MPCPIWMRYTVVYLLSIITRPLFLHVFVYACLSNPPTPLPSSSILSIETQCSSHHMSGRILPCLHTVLVLVSFIHSHLCVCLVIHVSHISVFCNPSWTVDLWLTLNGPSLSLRSCLIFSPSLSLLSLCVSLLIHLSLSLSFPRSL